MQDRPTAAELLEALGEYLEEDVMGAVEGPALYHTRVAANLLAILQREAEMGGPALVAARDRLARALDVEVSPGEAREQVLTLAAELQTRLRATPASRQGADDEMSLECDAWEALSEIVADKLAIARPGYDRYDSVIEAP